MAAPFVKFKIRDSWSLAWGVYVVKIWPIGPTRQGWTSENYEQNNDALKFIEAAIQEKLDREK